MNVLGVGVLVSNAEMSDEVIKQIFDASFRALGIHLSREEADELAVTGRTKLLSVDERDFRTITSAGDENIVRYLAKHVLGLDEDSQVGVTLNAKLWNLDREHSPWGKDVFACVWHQIE